SDYFNQNANFISFSSKDSWVILSPIEQQIKSKIEKIGIPLKDWDIQINYGIKTGYNDAFIISGSKKDEILANCKTEEERKKSAEIIRPLLRGRDIKRYSYEFADLYLICTFPSLKIDIEEYPAVKEHLLSFGKERLEQSGKTHEINGKRIKSRKKTNNKWFETQDSISYWEDFYK
ncbi:Eco57I restriction-modification methylase domain-containing protein, partial [Ornithobacterium rhinotracheale]